MDIWMHLIWNSFVAHVFCSPRSDTVLYGFAAFLRADWIQAMLLATVAGTLANFATYVMGLYLATFKDRGKFMLDEIQYGTIQRIMRRYGVFLLLVQAFPFYSLLPLAMGFFRVRVLHVVPLMAISLLIHHYMALVTVMELVAQ